MKCSFCETRWCSICRHFFKGRKSIRQHFAFYNVFGCPGLARSSDTLGLTLLTNLGIAILFPVTLFFAPMVVMIKNYQGVLLVSDQAERLRSKTSEYFHINLARVLVLIGFSLLGAICGVIFSVFGSFVGVPYQLLKTVSIFIRVLFGCEQKAQRRYPKSPMATAAFDNGDLS